MHQMQYNAPNRMYVFPKKNFGDDTPDLLLVLESRIRPPSKILAARLADISIKVSDRGRLYLSLTVLSTNQKPADVDVIK